MGTPSQPRLAAKSPPEPTSPTYNRNATQRAVAEEIVAATESEEDEVIVMEDVGTEVEMDDEVEEPPITMSR